MATQTTNRPKDANRDPITGEKGAHPVGAGVGAAAGTVAGTAAGVGAAMAAGAAAGTVAGPVGTAVGAVVGGIVGGVGGGLAGKAVAERIDPTVEEAYWEENFASRNYAKNDGFEKYRPAYRYGAEACNRQGGRSFEDIENDLNRDWASNRGASNLTWKDARPAVRDAYERAAQRLESCE